jgi:hypothetical protein
MLDAAIFVELVETRVGVSLQQAAKLFQVPPGMFALAIR